jgi:hypothetical protein
VEAEAERNDGARGYYNRWRDGGVERWRDGWAKVDMQAWIHERMDVLRCKTGTETGMRRKRGRNTIQGHAKKEKKNFLESKCFKSGGPFSLFPSGLSE